MTTTNSTDTEQQPVAVYVETHARPIAGGRWEVFGDARVDYVRPSGERGPAVVAESTLRGSPSWRLA